jgi:DNA topoisomerase I
MDATRGAELDVEAIDRTLEAVAEARLTYTTDQDPGYRRRRRGAGFSYETPSGGAVEPGVRAWIEGLAIPPAWTDVWISTRRNGHLLATGRDARGRKQYRYHPRWRQVRDEGKFDRLLDFALALPDLRASVDADLRRRTMDREHVMGIVVRLLDRTLVRVGNAEYAMDNGSFGLTTLRADHAAISRRQVVFCFTGKGGSEHEVAVRDPALARAVGRCHELGGQELFAFEGPDGEVVDVTSTHVNDYLRATTGLDISAKVFRTWGGTVVAAEHLARTDPVDEDGDEESRVLAAIDEAAAALGNTRAVCRASYIHPVVIEAYQEGALADVWSRVRQGTRMARGERLVTELLSS